MIYEIEKCQTVKPLFENWQETLIWSCLQHIMGHIYANHIETPASAIAILGDFCFLAGKPDQEIVSYKPEWCRQEFIIAVPQDDKWAELIETYYGDKARKVIRYAIKKETNVFNKDKLQEAVESLPKEYSIQMMDEALFNYCKETTWCRDWVSQFADYQMYKKLGLGAVILKDGVPVSGASSYSSYLGGIEIEIDTREDYRRRGLAFICGAKLILECLERGLYPSWDAQNKWSVALAEKLGYHFDHEYQAYEILGY